MACQYCRDILPSLSRDVLELVKAFPHSSNPQMDYHPPTKHDGLRTDGMAEEVDDAPVDPEALLAAEEGAKAVAYHTKYRPKKTLEAYLPRQEELK
ncbi:hypothetical protein VTN31DRAFT_4374 [Thermomyces dupontii]|uniref:uncharacterized protein n=1 Tax=Talaromyces thermophilus TaxID=28565 RepID=UPI0037430268